MEHSTPLLITSVAYYAIGLVLVIAALRLWFMHPIQRTPLLAVHLTPEGSDLVLKRWPLVYLYGAFILSCAFEHAAHWFHDQNLIKTSTLFIFGVTEAVISSVTAAYTILLSARWGLDKWKRK